MTIEVTRHDFLADAQALSITEEEVLTDLMWPVSQERSE